MGTTNAIVDEHGRTLKGTSPGSDHFGIPFVEGDLVHVLDAEAGVLPPNVDGTPAAENVVLFSARIGQGLSPLLEESGMFASAMTPRPADRQICVRVYNAKTLEEASFYTDSQAHFVSGSDDALFIVQAKQTDKPIDSNDDDGDGLNNSWEKSYGTDKNKKDTDGDGVSDGDEHAAGTGPLDEEDSFVVAQLSSQGGELVLTWASVPGRSYQVECNHGLVYEDLGGVVVATGAQTTFVLENVAASSHASYRVRLVQ